MMIDQPSSSNSNSRGCLSRNNKGEPRQTPHLARLPAYRRYDAYPLAEATLGSRLVAADSTFSG